LFSHATVTHAHPSSSNMQSKKHIFTHSPFKHEINGKQVDFIWHTKGSSFPYLERTSTRPLRWTTEHSRSRIRFASWKQWAYMGLLQKP